MKLHYLTKSPGLPLAAVAIMFSPVSAGADEKKISVNQAPDAVAGAIKKLARDAKLTNLEQVTENGETAYEATFESESTARTITLSASGNVLVEEVEIGLAEAPAAVRAAVKKHAGGGPVHRLERVTEGGKTTYEAIVGKGKATHEVQVSEKGEVLGAESAEDEKKDEPKAKEHAKRKEKADEGDEKGEHSKAHGKKGKEKDGDEEENEDDEKGEHSKAHGKKGKEKDGDEEENEDNEKGEHRKAHGKKGKEKDEDEEENEDDEKGEHDKARGKKGKEKDEDEEENEGDQKDEHGEAGEK